MKFSVFIFDALSSVDALKYFIRRALEGIFGSFTNFTNGSAA
jgi:predicted methyltransferase